MLNLKRAIELVSELSRTRNYPKDDNGVMGLAKGLIDASERSQVGAGRIIERCRLDSEFCPTDHDLLMVARELARTDAVIAGTYDSTASDSTSVKRNKRCPACDGSGWCIIWTLHTRTPNGSWKFAQRENITEDAARVIEKSDGWPNATQRIYSGAARCTDCQAAEVA